MRILITGAAGMLGTDLAPVLREAGHEVITTDIRILAGLDDYFDVTDLDLAKGIFNRWQPDCVFHLAAITDLEQCELAPNLAYRVNALGTRNIALECRRNHIPMVYISSAGVFDGEQDEYTEFDSAYPINVYGKSKLEGEWMCPEDCYIIRAGWMMSGGPGHDHKFVSYIITQIDLGSTDIYAVDDKIGTPTYGHDLSKVAIDLVETGMYGTWHAANGPACTRYDVAMEIVSLLGLNDRVTVHPVSSDYFAEVFATPRPTSEVLRNYVMELEGVFPMRPWYDTLAEYLRRWK